MPLRNPEHVCGNCEWFQPDEVRSVVGYCHKNPPVTKFLTGPKGVCPEIPITFWCGAFRKYVPLGGKK